MPSFRFSRPIEVRYADPDPRRHSRGASIPIPDAWHARIVEFEGKVPGS